MRFPARLSQSIVGFVQNPGVAAVGARLSRRAECISAAAHAPPTVALRFAPQGVARGEFLQARAWPVRALVQGVLGGNGRWCGGGCLLLRGTPSARASVHGAHGVPTCPDGESGEKVGMCMAAGWVLLRGWRVTLEPIDRVFARMWRRIWRRFARPFFRRALVRWVEHAWQHVDTRLTKTHTNTLKTRPPPPPPSHMHTHARLWCTEAARCTCAEAGEGRQQFGGGVEGW